VFVADPRFSTRLQISLSPKRRREFAEKNRVRHGTRGCPVKSDVTRSETSHALAVAVLKGGTLKSLRRRTFKE